MLRRVARDEVLHDAVGIETGRERRAGEDRLLPVAQVVEGVEDCGDLRLEFGFLTLQVVAQRLRLLCRDASGLGRLLRCRRGGRCGIGGLTEPFDLAIGLRAEYVEHHHLVEQLLGRVADHHREEAIGARTPVVGLGQLVDGGLEARDLRLGCRQRVAVRGHTSVEIVLLGDPGVQFDSGVVQSFSSLLGPT